MQIIKWNPMRDMFGLRNRMFDDFFFPRTIDDEGMLSWSWNPVVDIYDNDDAIVIKAELPGVSKKDITVDVNDRVLTLKGERSANNEVKEDHYYRRESTYGKFERTFTLPADVDPDKIKADYKDGILKIEVPKPEDKKPKQVTVH
ncbi:MAG: Hsp20/alpha crystallin family protein [Deltaproteobacteria bacterium]|nr:MAG: Hsp20/alpha crystallin family protein [Deltaproteobacteria bacterium]